ncbi:phosphoglycerol transferase MdoB-like AlkP superfamily enzyme [Pedobacter sp. CG_S7]|uniref:LTA synthase family protein n=1 Tax=Pedobacter sp. CG_S7 TaxID=3143930 RepID=UPI0033991A8C
MFKNFLQNRYSIFTGYILYFLISSFLIRTTLLLSASQQTSFGITAILKLYLTGLFYDFGTVVFLTFSYSLYLLVIPNRFNSHKVNQLFTIVLFSFFVFLSLFSFFAELTFWQEFESRFNFIAVDYLIYTYEVVNNINESYPLPILIGGMLLTTFGLSFIFYKLNVFKSSFQSNTPLKYRLYTTGCLFLLLCFYGLIVKNSWTENSRNRYANELSKAGIYSFFAAFKNNELNYREFYHLIDNNKAFELIRAELKKSNAVFKKPFSSISRTIDAGNSTYRPNVIMITVESLSADFMAYYGNTQNLTPVLDSLAKNSIFFSNMYATGTRTVRGMEALSLSIPPTPGSSIVRRPENELLFSIGHVFNQKKYISTFFYGGDGYFDNMNHYFGNNGYNIVDRGRKILNDDFPATRTPITDKEVKFENAWGVCDEDVLNVVIEDADKKFKQHQLFNNFVMTTSNHRPFTYPNGKINIPSGTNREGAVRYTDYAIGSFLKKIKTKPWYNNTVVIIIADHCASSAGKNEIDLSKYQIPCMILNVKGELKQNISTMSSQIDLFPTLWSLMGWKYESNFYGQNVLDPTYQPRVLLGTYQKLVYMKSDSLVILSPQRKVETYIYNKAKNEQIPAVFPKLIISKAIANYQTAYDLFKSGGLRQ